VIGRRIVWYTCANVSQLASVVRFRRRLFCNVDTILYRARRRHVRWDERREKFVSHR